jgi:hypothetical protein
LETSSSKVVGGFDNALFPGVDDRDDEVAEWRIEGEDLKGTGGIDMRTWLRSTLSASPADELDRVPETNWEFRLP